MARFDRAVVEVGGRDGEDGHGGVGKVTDKILGLVSEGNVEGKQRAEGEIREIIEGVSGCGDGKSDVPNGNVLVPVRGGKSTLWKVRLLRGQSTRKWCMWWEE